MPSLWLNAREAVANLAAVGGEGVVLGRDPGGKFLTPVSLRIYLTERKGPANPAAGGGIVVALRGNIAGMTITLPARQI